MPDGIRLGGALASVRGRALWMPGLGREKKERAKERERGVDYPQDHKYVTVRLIGAARARAQNWGENMLVTPCL
jgi:hypothetical protein